MVASSVLVVRCPWTDIHGYPPLDSATNAPDAPSRAARGRGAEGSQLRRATSDASVVGEHERIGLAPIAARIDVAAVGAEVAQDPIERLG